MKLLMSMAFVRNLSAAFGLALLLAGPGAAVQPDEVLDDPVLEERAREISKDLRCLVCRNESIDESNAQLARDLRLLVREESTRDMDQGLRAGRFDRIISTPEDHPGTQITTLFTEQLWLATPLDHRLADRGAPVPLDQLRGETLLTIGAGHRLSHVVAGLAAQSGAQVSQEYEGTSLDAVRLMAASGTGLAILPEVYALSEAKRGTDLCMRPLAGAGTSRTLSLIQPALPDPRAGSDILVEVLRAEAARILRP